MPHQQLTKTSVAIERKRSKIAQLTALLENLRIRQHADCQLAEKSARGLDNSWTEQIADSTARGLDELQTKLTDLSTRG